MEGFHEHRFLQQERLRRFCRTIFHDRRLDLGAVPSGVVADNIMHGCAVYTIYAMAAASFKKQVRSYYYAGLG